MSQIVPFNFEGHGVRAVDIDGEPWFVGKDIAEALGYANPQKAIRDHCKNSRPVGVNESVTPLDAQTVIINEPDLFRLIVKSQLPEADRFEKWVFEEVLPAIRRTGGYGRQASPDLSSDEARLVMIQELAAKQLALIVENKQLADQRDHAVATKAEIGSRREATAMAKASAATRENSRLRDELGWSSRQATILAVEKVTGMPEGTYGWRPLKAWCQKNGVTPQVVPDRHYVEVKAWPAGAWRDVYGIDLGSLFPAPMREAA